MTSPLAGLWRPAPVIPAGGIYKELTHVQETEQ